MAIMPCELQLTLLVYNTWRYHEQAAMLNLKPIKMMKNDTFLVWKPVVERPTHAGVMTLLNWVTLNYSAFHFFLVCTDSLIPNQTWHCTLWCSNFILYNIYFNKKHSWAVMRFNKKRWKGKPKTKTLFWSGLLYFWFGWNSKAKKYF